MKKQEEKQKAPKGLKAINACKGKQGFQKLENPEDLKSSTFMARLKMPLMDKVIAKCNRLRICKAEAARRALTLWLAASE